jgi:hypothetical protein
MAENSSSGATLPIAGMLGAVAPQTRWSTDDWPAYQDLPGVRHNTITLGPMAAHIALSWIHRLFSNLKCWGVGVYHGLRTETALKRLETGGKVRRNERGRWVTAILAASDKRTPSAVFKKTNIGPPALNSAENSHRRPPVNSVKTH